MHIVVLGAGSWGTAISAHIALKHKVTLWLRDEELAHTINISRQNPKYLPGINLPMALTATSNLALAIKDMQSDLSLMLIATPIAALTDICQKILTIGTIPKQVVLLCKGIARLTIPSNACQATLENYVLPQEILHSKWDCDDTINAYDKQSLAMLSGPSFAREVANKLPCALVAATKNNELQQLIQLALHHNHMRIYASYDLIGLQVCGAVKNVLAIAAGISDGLSLGFNARAALITRGLSEMTRLCTALGGSPKTCMGLAGIGDLLLTATGSLSRNHQVGQNLAKKIPLTQILDKLGHVAEGVYSAQAILILAKKNKIDMPICESVAKILSGHLVTDAVQNLLTRSSKNED